MGPQHFAGLEDDRDVRGRQRTDIAECPLQVSPEQAARVVAVLRRAFAAEQVSDADVALLVEPLVERGPVHHRSGADHRGVREHGQLPGDGIDQVQVRLQRIVATGTWRIRIEQQDLDLAREPLALVGHDAFQQGQAARAHPDDADAGLVHLSSPIKS
jgi:hypothetical protein